MPIISFIATVLGGIVESEAHKLLAFLESKLPGSIQQFVDVAGAATQVDALLAKLAGQGVTEVEHLLEKGLAWVEGEVRGHVHGTAGAFLVSKLDALRTAQTFTQEEADEFAVLVAAGKWAAVREAFLKDLGLA